MRKSLRNLSKILLYTNSSELSRRFVRGMRCLVDDDSFTQFQFLSKDNRRYNYYAWDFAMDGSDLGENDWSYVYLNIDIYGKIVFSAHRDEWRKNKNYCEYHMELDLNNLELKADSRQYLSGHKID